MKKRFATFLITMLSCVCFAFGLAACEGTGSIEHQHAYGAWEQSLAPTCTTAGKESRTCATCQEKEERDVVALGHDYVDDAENSKAPTCQEAGVNAKKCSVCGDVTTSAGDPIDPTAHNYVVDAENSTAATCKDAGVTVEKCTVCGDTKQTPVAATGNHSYAADPDNTKAPTCSAAGINGEKCTVCGDVKTTTGDPATGTHSYVADPDNTKAPTCTEAGVNAEKCTVCGDVKTTVGDPATGTAHNYVADPENTKAPTCGAAGVNAEKCTVCGDVKTTAGDSATGNHTFALVAAECTKATCKSEGLQVSKCTVCQEEKRETVPMLNHNYKQDGAQSVEPKCGVAGKVVYVCQNENCGDSYTETVKALTHNFIYNAEKSSAATCTTVGKEVKVCEHCKAEESKTLKALGHSWVCATDEMRAAKECEDAVCVNCEETLKATKAHDYRVVSEWISCVEDGENELECKLCGKTSTEFVAARGQHSIDDEDWQDVSYELVDGKACTYLKVREAYCEYCEQTVEESDEVVDHDYEFAVIKEATCAQAGTKGYKCSVCNALQPGEKTVSYTAEHTWDEGVIPATDGEIVVKTYTCLVGGCGATRQEFVATQAPVNKNDLAEEVKLGGDEGAVISMDEDTLNGLGDAEMILGAEGVSKEQLAGENIQGLDEVADDVTIYNITLTVGGEAKTEFDGLVTVKIPYTLKPEDDPACITVFYLSEGELKKMEGVYNDGYVTFQTDHFSYYTVGRYTVADICRIYGHNYVKAEKAATCTTAGYLLETCTRCQGNSNNHKPMIPALGHTTEVTDSKAATCTEDGYEKYKCSVCAFEYTVTEHAIGHSWVADETESKAATCTEAGKNVTHCESCDATNEITLPQLAHKYVAVVTAPTCTEGGKSVFTCSLCQGSYEGAYTEALGHKWSIEEPTCGAGQVCLVCNEAGKPATGEHDMVEGECTVCGFGCNHKFELTEEIKATCYEGGYSVYTCSECGKTETKDFTKPAGHAYPNGFENCTVCGEENTAIVDSMKSLLSSLTSRNYTLKLQDVSIKSFVRYDNGKEEVQMQINEGDILEMYISIAEDGSIQFYVKVYVQGFINEESLDETVEMYGDGEYMYGIAENNGRFDYIRIAYEEVFAEMGLKINGEMINANTPAMMLEGMLNELLGADTIAAWKEAWESNEDLFYTVIGKVFTTVFNGEKVEGNVSFTVNVEGLKKLNENLSKLTVEGIVNEYFGENAFADLEKFVIGLENKTVKNVVDAILSVAEERNISTELIYSTIDLVVTAATSNPFDTQATLNQSGMMDVTVAQLVEMLMGGGAEQAADDVITEGDETEGGDVTGDETETPVFNYAETIKGLFAQIKDINVYDMASQGKGEMVYEMVNQIVAAAQEMTSFTFTVNEKGEFIGLTFQLEKFELVVGGGSVGGNVVKPEVDKPTVDGMLTITEEEKEEGGYTGYESVVLISGTATLLPTGGIPTQAEEVKTVVVEKYAAMMDVIKAAVENAEGKQLTLRYSEDSSYYAILGKNETGGIYLELYDIVRMYDDKYDENGNITQPVEVPVLVKRIEDLEEMGQINFNTHCTDSVSLYYSAETEDGRYYSHIEIYVDLKTKTLSTRELHDYKKMTAEEVKAQIGANIPLSPEEADCGDYWYTYYKCTKCGNLQMNMSWKEHEYEKRSYLADGSESCTDGVIYEEYCPLCNKVFDSDTSFGHDFKETAIKIETPHGEKTVYCGVCLCGEETSFNPNNNGEGDGCQLEHYEGEAIFDANDNQIGWQDRYNCVITHTEETEEPTACPFYMIVYDYNGVEIAGECKIEKRTEYKFFLNGEQVGKMYISRNYEANHDFQPNSVTEYYDDEKTQIKHSENSSLCTVCGKGYFEKYDYDEIGRKIRYEHADTSYAEKNYYYLTITEYESLTSCNYTRWSTNDKDDLGEPYTGTEHVINGASTLVASATCTQPRITKQACSVCQQSQYYVDYNNVREHKFTWTGEIYRCTSCGLESVSGVSDIVMEDLTNHAVYGSENHYVIGFYQRKNEQSLQAVLTLKHKTDETDMRTLKMDTKFSHYSLSNFNWYYGDTLVYISKAELQAYAENNGLNLAEYILEVTLIPAKVNPDQGYSLTNTIGLTDLLGTGDAETNPPAEGDKETDVPVEGDKETDVPAEDDKETDIPAEDETVTSPRPEGSVDGKDETDASDGDLNADETVDRELVA